MCTIGIHAELTIAKVLVLIKTGNCKHMRLKEIKIINIGCTNKKVSMNKRSWITFVIFNYSYHIVLQSWIIIAETRNFKPDQNTKWKLHVMKNTISV